MEHAMSPRLRRFVWSCIAVGTLLRLALSFISFGSNDALIWEHIAARVQQSGLIQAYRTETFINHPPIPVLWARLSLALGGEPLEGAAAGTVPIAKSWPRPWFSFVLKLPAIAADALVVALVAWVWLAWGDESQARFAALAMALNPVAIIISGYHCNTDSVYAALSLLSAYLVSHDRRFFLGGLALGAAINVKLIPLLLIPALFSLCSNWREARRLVYGLAIAALPFLPLLAAPEALYRNMVAYVPSIGRWGVGYFLLDFSNTPRFSDVGYHLMRDYLKVGRLAIVVAVGVVTIASWRTKRWNAYELCLIVYSIFLVLAPGFGTQYLIVVLPLLLVVSISRAWTYSISGGLFLLLMYWSSLVSERLPLLTFLSPSQEAPPAGGLFGLLAWWVLLTTAVTLVFRVARRLDPIPAP
jgi:Gpi18-like mannosyltransferase